MSILLRIRNAVQPVRRLWYWLRSSPSPQVLLQRLLRCARVLCGVACVGGGIFLLALFLTLPDVDDIGALVAMESTVIMDRDGVELYRIHGEEDRTWVPLDHIADTVEQAAIAIEDERFYTRGCFDPRAFLRAALRNIFGGFGSQGGSTITQQFAKNALIGTRKKRVSRKVKEYMLSCMLERRYSKDAILEMYLNRIPYGHNAHGVEQAAQTYFAKSATGLTLAEAAVLAALPQLPTYFSPYGAHVRTTLSAKGEERLRLGELRSPEDVRDDDFWIGLISQTIGTGSSTFTIGGRTDQVLKDMEEQGFISPPQRQQALRELQQVSFQRARENIRAPHFVLWVREQVEELFRDRFAEGFLEQGGLRVVTTMNFTLQQQAERIVAEQGEQNLRLYGVDNASLLSVDPTTGHILAYVGNRDYWDEKTNGNVDMVRAPRQPGSSFKPFSYAAAFLRGYHPATVLYDVPMRVGDDEPENFDGTFWGPLTIRQALGASRNIPAAQSFFLAGGEDAIVSLAAAMGVPTVQQRREELTAARGVPYEYGWPLSIGAAEVPLLEMVQGYTTFARGGNAINLVSILRVEDRQGNILYESAETPEGRDALDPRAAFMITSILSDESARPTEFWRKQLSIPGFATAGKTGTSNKCLRRVIGRSTVGEGKCIDSRPADNWAMGYTPVLATGVWAGNASGGTLSPRASGLDVASSLWKEFMVVAHATLQRSEDTAARLQTTFPTPQGLVSAQISELSGKLASPCTPLEWRRADLFFEGQQPLSFDDACVEVEVDRLTGLLASHECPPDARERRTFLQPHSILSDRFPHWEEAVQKWARQVSAGTGSLYWKVVAAAPQPVASDGQEATDAQSAVRRVFRGTGAFLPLPLPLAPTEECRLTLTPGRLEKPTLQILSPTAGGVATAPSFQPHIQYTVGQAVHEVQYELDGRIVALQESGSTIMPALKRTEDTASGPLITLPRRFDTSGTHTLRVTLVDSYFNQVSDSVEFRFGEDTAPPLVTILAPDPNVRLRIGTQISVRAQAADRDGTVDRVQFFLGEALMLTRREEPYEASFVVSGEPGLTVLRVVAQDAARNQGSAEVEIILTGN